MKVRNKFASTIHHDHISTTIPAVEELPKALCKEGRRSSRKNFSKLRGGNSIKCKFPSQFYPHNYALFPQHVPLHCRHHHYYYYYYYIHYFLLLPTYLSTTSTQPPFLVVWPPPLRPLLVLYKLERTGKRMEWNENAK